MELTYTYTVYMYFLQYNLKIYCVFLYFLYSVCPGEGQASTGGVTRKAQYSKEVYLCERSSSLNVHDFKMNRAVPPPHHKNGSLFVRACVVGVESSWTHGAMNRSKS